MAFKLDESAWDKQRTAFGSTLEGLAQELEVAAALRAGAMDSQSRADEVARQKNVTLQTVAQRLREIAAKPVNESDI